jgi:AcrR family transcriptional regulator
MSENKLQNRQTTRSINMLRNAFVEILKEKPYEKIKISEISARADLARSTFYAHFETKDDLLTSYIDEIAEAYLGGYSTPTEWTKERNIIDLEKEVAFFQGWKNLNEIAVMIHDPYIEELFYRAIRNMHMKAYMEIVSPMRPDLNPCFASYWIEFLVSTKIALLRNWVKNDMKESPDILGELLYSLSGIPVFERTYGEFKEKIC